MKKTIFLLLILITKLCFAQNPCKLDNFIGDVKADKQLSDAIAKNPDLVDAWKKLDDAGIDGAIRKNPDWLKRVDDWDKGGVSVAPDPSDKKLKLFSSNGGNKVAEVTPDGKLLPEKYDYPKSGTGTPVGQPKNGYQIYKNGDDVSVRRVPEKSAYSQSELTELTQHPNAHVLERHGHDVTDEALIKRANTGIAPDGNITNPPPYSSKFETADQLKKALDNTRNGTPAFANKTRVGNTNRYTVEYTLADGTTFGKGVPRNGSTFESMNKVFAVYEEVSPGDFKLITMYPNK